MQVAGAKLEKAQQLEAEARRRMAEASADKQVARLQEELDTAQHQLASVKQEYAAFKAHSQTLLQKERDMNARLRHLQQAQQ